MPDSPWIGSISTPTTFGFIAAFAASRSPYGTIVNPGVNGPKPSLYCSSSEKPTTVVVRPWKFPVKTRISACPSGTPLTW